MRAFRLLWLGQLVSLLGSGLTGFALGVWVYRETGSVTRFALIYLVTTLPGIVVSPLAGALVDRFDRRRTLILGDAGAAAVTLVLALLLAAGRLEIWQIVLLLGLASCFSALQVPALAAATPLLVGRDRLDRANGLVQLADAAARVVAPLLAGVLVESIALWGVLLIDGLTFLASLAVLLVIRIPAPPRSAAGRAAAGSLWREAAAGWAWLRGRPGLLALLVLLAGGNLVMGTVQVLLTPLVLGFASAAVLGVVLAVGSLGLVAGGLALHLWGGPRQRVAGILALVLLQGAILLLGGLRPSAPLIAGAAFAFLAGVPVVVGASQTIWQLKVPPDLQGRAFAIRRMVVWSTLPFAYLAAGPLADRVFEPLMAAGGPLAGTAGRLLGTGPGRGIGLFFMTLGLFQILLALAAGRYAPLRRVESDLPDALAEEPVPPAATAAARPGA